MSEPFLKVTADFTDQFNEIISKFKRDAVLVGIPEEKTDRKDDAPINNATILAMNNFGSPANNIPATHVMERGIKNAKEAIAEELKKATKAALTQGFKAVDQYYNRAGILAASSIKKVINAQEGMEPLSDATLAARKRAGFKGTKRLIVTGQTRNAITYVIPGDK